MSMNEISESQFIKFIINHPSTCKHLTKIEIRQHISDQIKYKFINTYNYNRYLKSCYKCPRTYITTRFIDLYVNNLYTKTKENNNILLNAIKFELNEFKIP